MFFGYNKVTGSVRNQYACVDGATKGATDLALPQGANLLLPCVPTAIHNNRRFTVWSALPYQALGTCVVQGCGVWWGVASGDRTENADQPVAKSLAPDSLSLSRSFKGPFVFFCVLKIRPCR